MRRLRRIEVSPEFLTDLMREGGMRAAMVSHGIPDGARMVQMNVEPVTLMLSLYVEHESFAPVEVGREIPRLNVILRVYAPPDGEGAWADLSRAAEAAFPDRADALTREAYRKAHEDGRREGLREALALAHGTLDVGGSRS